MHLNGVSKEVFLSDVHFPFEDPKAWALTMKILRHTDPDLIWLGGDIIDFYAVSRWDKRPARRLMLQEEIDRAKRGLAQLRKVCPNARMVWQIGNHEERFLKYLWGKAPELSVLDALTFEELFKLSHYDVTFLNEYTASSVGKLFHIHGDKAPGGGVNHARAKLGRVHDNIIFGHHHTHQIAFERDLGGNPRGSYANGCLCGLEPEYAPFNDWTQGITMVQYTKSGHFHPDPIVYFPGAKPDTLATVVEGNYLESKVIA